MKRGKLTVGRRLGEQVLIGQGQELITVTVERLGAGRVRLSIDAPVNVPVARAELDRAEEQRL